MSAHVLDDRSAVTRLDPKEMLRLTEEFPDQCERALALTEEVAIEAPPNLPNVAMLSGLGGSAAGGDIVRAIFDAHAGIPFVVNRDYHLPNYLGLGDILFCASYSGNTEETLSVCEEAKSTGARIIAVTSGGKLAAMAEAEGHTLIKIPGGQPPRTALGYMCMPVLAACQKLNLIPAEDYGSLLTLLRDCVRRWTVETPFASNEAKQIAQALHGKLPVLYGLGGWQALVANRWKGQINENAKCMAFYNGFPELNHNEILGWVKADEQGVDGWAVVVLQTGKESEKMRTRARVTEQLIGKTAEFYHANAPGENLLQQILSLTLMGDFVSLYLAALNEVDPETIDSINVLKAELAKVD
jgi:glucose/mannose-6-phosphate isomerase